MNLTAWVSRLTAAARPLDLVELRTGAERIAERAQGLTNGQVAFSVTSTPTGAMITANPPSLLAQRALNRALKEDIDAIAAAMAAQGRERLIGSV